MNWEEHQAWEAEWWGNCINTFGEEGKQISYAHRMGLINQPRGETWPSYDLQGKRILDIGGGPVSMLLKCVNGSRMVVVDPCKYPDWVASRYETAGIKYYIKNGEDVDVTMGVFDEVWIYNVLQHTREPDKIIQNAKKVAPILRIFEIIDVPSCPGHPHELKAHKLTEWINQGQENTQHGTVEAIKGENALWGTFFYGVFSFSVPQVAKALSNG